MRVQLTLFHCLLFILIIILSVLLTYWQTSPLAILLIMAIVVILGTALSWIVTTILLRPLERVTDAAQAIATGDLEQRERLLLPSRPQDEVDRLAGSLNEMASKLARAQDTQHVSEERFRRFFCDASHQLRTPLTSIHGFTELLMRGAKDDPEMIDHILVRMKNETERMTNLINDLLTLARLSDQHPLKLQYTDLVELATESIERARARAHEDCQILLNIATNACLGLQVDRDRMKQLLFILLDNALKHGSSAADGTVTLQLDKQRGQVIIIVKDNGKGIAPEDLDHIFDAFYRGSHQSLTGAGLGLTIASAIVRAHHGTISASRSAEQGTEFKVILPDVA